MAQDSPKNNLAKVIEELREYNINIAENQTFKEK